MNIKKNKKGFTLLELLIAITIFAIAVAGMGQVTFLAVKSFRRQQKMLKMIQNAEFALDRMTREVAAAAFVHSSLPSPALPPKFAVTDDAGQSSMLPERLDFNAWIYNSAEMTTAGEVVELHYRIYNDVDFGYTLQRDVVPGSANIPDADILNTTSANKGNIIAFECDDLQVESLTPGTSTWVDNWAAAGLPERVRVTIQMYDPDGEVSPMRISADVATHQ